MTFALKLMFQNLSMKSSSKVEAGKRLSSAKFRINEPLNGHQISVQWMPKSMSFPSKPRLVDHLLASKRRYIFRNQKVFFKSNSKDTWLWLVLLIISHENKTKTKWPKQYNLIHIEGLGSYFSLSGYCGISSLSPNLGVPGCQLGPLKMADILSWKLFMHCILSQIFPK